MHQGPGITELGTVCVPVTKQGVCDNPPSSEPVLVGVFDYPVIQSVVRGLPLSARPLPDSSGLRGAAGTAHTRSAATRELSNRGERRKATGEGLRSGGTAPGAGQEAMGRAAAGTRGAPRWRVVREGWDPDDQRSEAPAMGRGEGHLGTRCCLYWRAGKGAGGRAEPTRREGPGYRPP